MNGIAGRVKALTDANPRWMSAAVRKELAFLGADNMANKSAVENLIAMGRQNGAKARYLRYGDKTARSCSKQLKVHVLGPPDLTQTDRDSQAALERQGSVLAFGQRFRALTSRCAHGRCRERIEWTCGSGASSLVSGPPTGTEWTGSVGNRPAARSTDEQHRV